MSFSSRSFFCTLLLILLFTAFTVDAGDRCRAEYEPDSCLGRRFCAWCNKDPRPFCAEWDPCSEKFTDKNLSCPIKNVLADKSYTCKEEQMRNALVVVMIVITGLIFTVCFFAMCSLHHDIRDILCCCFLCWPCCDRGSERARRLSYRRKHFKLQEQPEAIAALTKAQGDPLVFSDNPPPDMQKDDDKPEQKISLLPV